MRPRKKSTEVILPETRSASSFVLLSAVFVRTFRGVVIIETKGLVGLGDYKGYPIPKMSKKMLLVKVLRRKGHEVLINGVLAFCGRIISPGYAPLSPIFVPDNTPFYFPPDDEINRI